jgi:hypothetical protein
MTTDSRPPADGDDGQWRDERRLPLDELSQAVATSSNEGQMDDRTGNDAGMEPPPAQSSAEGDPDPDSAAGRAPRTDFTGPVGPN